MPVPTVTTNPGNLGEFREGEALSLGGLGASPRDTFGRAGGKSQPGGSDKADHAALIFRGLTIDQNQLDGVLLDR